MRMVDLIVKKRDGVELSQAEIKFIIEGFTKGEIPDYQMAAFAMAIYFKDMTPKERADLTLAMVESGDQIDLSTIEGIKVDKHSTGGVGDTTTLVLAPLVAACGVPVAKMSGRGLGHTGGTIDKLESVSGFNVEITNDQFINLVNENKLAVIGQSANLTPADKKLYSLRDVTATVNSIPLIASSIMSKKIAAGADAIVLDVKTGSGAFMEKLDDSIALAEAMVEIGNNINRKTIAIISDMNQPLGFAIGNALEVKEAIDTLQGKGPRDLEELCLSLGANMVLLADKASSVESAKEKLMEVIQNGKALSKFKQFLEAQGGDSSIVDHPEKLPQAEYQLHFNASEGGYISGIQANTVGKAAMLLGAGRTTKESQIDLAVGIVLHKKIGDKVSAGEALATVHSNREEVQDVIELLDKAFTITNEPVTPKQLIHTQIK